MTKGEITDLLTFTEEILNGKLHFLYSVCVSFSFFFAEVIVVSKIIRIGEKAGLNRHEKRELLQ